MGTAQSLKAGQEVIVIGSALGTLQNSVSRGIVSGLRNSGGVTLVQSDAAANPGNSGGPMLDRNGRVVGILTAGYKGQQGLNFAVAIDHARDILEGRQTNLGSAQTGLADIEPMRPGGAASGKRPPAAAGRTGIPQRVGALPQRPRTSSTAYWKRFRSSCYKSPIRGSYDREWFAVFAPGAIPGDAAAGCTDYYQSDDHRDEQVPRLHAADGAGRAPCEPAARHHPRRAASEADQFRRLGQVDVKAPRDALTTC